MSGSGPIGGSNELVCASSVSPSGPAFAIMPDARIFSSRAIAFASLRPRIASTFALRISASLISAACAVAASLSSASWRVIVQADSACFAAC